MIVIWDAETGAEIRTLKGHTNIIESLSFSRDGKYLVSGSDDGTCILWKWK
jgi:WD40 repeat protein